MSTRKRKQWKRKKSKLSKETPTSDFLEESNSRPSSPVSNPSRSSSPIPLIARTPKTSANSLVQLAIEQANRERQPSCIGKLCEKARSVGRTIKRKFTRQGGKRKRRRTRKRRKSRRKSRKKHHRRRKR